MERLTKKIEAVLERVRKPARYAGGEWNAVLKEQEAVDCSMVLAFPDLYEVAMSNEGLRVLYHCVNREPRLLMERVCAPAPDMEALLVSEKIPLFSLESRRPLADFDLLGFSLQYELSYTTVLNMLHLAGIPLYSAERQEEQPLVVGGGPCACNPEPLAPFFDLFVLGEAEELLPRLMQQVATLRSEGASREELITRLAAFPGVYVPSLYRFLSPGEGGAGRLQPLDEGVPARVQRLLVPDLDHSPCPTRPIVPYTGVVHDRAVVELFRGCARGCLFCQAGAVYRPVRRRSPEKVIAVAEEILDATGHEELSLASLSSSDYPRLHLLLEDLDRVLEGRRIRLSLPSLRLDSYSVGLADRLHRGRRSSLTFAPEAATERLRRVIGKNLSEEQIFFALEEAVRAGWQGFKLYFMIGLPTEREEDVRAIVDLCRRIRLHFQRKAGKRVAISVSVSTFVPKAHTPFQWAGQLPLAQIEARQQLLRKGFRSLKGVDLSWHEAAASLLEALLARGDRGLAPLLEKAWRRGSRLDGWSEYFSFVPWQAAMDELGLDGQALACRSLTPGDFLPWAHLDCSRPVTDLWQQYGQALEESPGTGET